MSRLSRIVPVLAIFTLAVPTAAAQALPFFTNTAQTVGFESNAFRTFSRWVRRTAPQPDGEVEVFAQVLALPVRLGPETVLTVAAPVMRRELRTPGLEPSSLSTSGWGDLTVSIKQRVYVNNFSGGGVQLAVLGGLKLPTGDHDRRHQGELLPASLQLGSGSVDFPLGAVFTAFRERLGFNAEAGYRFNRSSQGVNLGNEASLDLALGYRLFPTAYRSMRDRVLNAYLEWNLVSAQRATRAGQPTLGSGGTVAFLSPGLQWVLGPRLLVEGAVQIPVAQDWNETQPEFEPTVNLGLRLLF